MSTTDNLKAAFAGESQANRKYLAFAKKASTEGYSQTFIFHFFCKFADLDQAGFGGLHDVWTLMSVRVALGFLDGCLSSELLDFPFFIFPIRFIQDLIPCQGRAPF